ncbi:helix-turn-helix transcriptional regulator [Nocardia sp. NPDC052278]|uniref:helix-turn-helix transcriptional regulator n=1 Tax=unclassified Nocardia TaxID=2637762 RepID=UPI0036BA1C4A
MNDQIAEPDRQPATVADRLAREIKRLRLDAALTQRELAAKIGYSRQYVSMTEWEDANLPSLELVSAIDTALGAHGALITLRAQAKTDQQAIRRQTGFAAPDSNSMGDSHAVSPSVVDECIPPVSLDPRTADAATMGPAGHPHDLTEVNAIYPCQAKAAGEIRILAKEAAAIDIMAVRGLGILGLNDSLLRKAIPVGARLRVLLLSPDSAAVARRADEIGESAESFAAGIRLATTRIKELTAQGISIEVYTYDQIPVWRIIRIDEVLFVSAFTIQHEGHASPIHRIEPSPRGVLHKAFVRTLEQAFSHADQIV